MRDGGRIARGSARPRAIAAVGVAAIAALFASTACAVDAAWLQACAGCHGARGEGDANARVPRIAGQPARYLARQLDGYADGRRQSAVMEPVARAMSVDLRREAAMHYAAIEPADGRASRVDPPVAPERIVALVTLGDRARRVQGCAHCHGANGRGELPDVPYLGGQHASYLADALRAWRGGARDTDPAGQMPQIARALDDEDVDALANYFASQSPPGRVDARGAPPDGAVRR